ncbi:MAG: monovalent cation:proton antiporter-2 (CPA2) family protein [Phenylobacterium sp.]|uniref:monovalent cation:proton antiporter-2 (CPA2) family protein n=1 Tax=Phenylobacterium sp. TaxID=1871053 RepID=UPI003918A062
MDTQSLLTQALVYLAAGVISVPIAKRLGLGSVLGYLFAGMAVGPFALNLVGEAADVMRFAEFGVVILLFLIGLEVRPALLWRLRSAIFGVGGVQMALTTAVLAGAGTALGLDWRTAVAAGLMLAMSSTAIVLQSLEEKGLRRGPVGEASFGVLLFQDLAVIPLFAILPLLAVAAPQHAAEAAHGTSLVEGLPGWQRMLAALAAMGAVIFGGRYLTRPLFRFIAAARLREIFTASALLLVVGVAFLMQMVGLSPALGAFLAGVVLAESEFRRELETDIEPFRGLLLGLFFITVGAGLDFGVVAERPAALLGVVVGLMVLKAGAMFASARLFRFDKRDALLSGAALAQGGEFAFVLITFALGSGVVGAELAKFLTAVVAVSMAAAPLAMSGMERLLLMRPAKAEREMEAPQFDDGEPDVIVAGFGRFGQIAARLLMANGFNAVTLDSSIEQIDLLRRFGREVHYGDASRLDLLSAAGADKARVLLVAIDDRDKAVEMVEAARQAFPNLTILARAWDRRHAYELLRSGADDVERETFEAGLALGRRALERLGQSPRRAVRAANLFRQQDEKLFRKLAPIAGEEERYLMATRDSRETMDRLLRAEMARLADDEEETAPDLRDSTELEAHSQSV